MARYRSVRQGCATRLELRWCTPPQQTIADEMIALDCTVLYRVCTEREQHNKTPLLMLICAIHNYPVGTVHCRMAVVQPRDYSSSSRWIFLGLAIMTKLISQDPQDPCPANPDPTALPSECTSVLPPYSVLCTVRSKGVDLVIKPPLYL